MMWFNPTAVEEAVKRTVTIEALNTKSDYRSRFSTGFIYRTGLVVTNEHVLDLGTEVKVSGQEAKVLDNGSDKGLDLMLLQTETADMPPLEFETNYRLLEPVFSYCGDYNGFGPIATAGHICQLSAERILTTARSFKGNSGSLLWHGLIGKPIGLMYEREKFDRVFLSVAIPAATLQIYIRDAISRLNYHGNLKLF